jgi:hypothetical protein
MRLQADDPRSFSAPTKKWNRPTTVFTASQGQSQAWVMTNPIHFTTGDLSFSNSPRPSRNQKDGGEVEASHITPPPRPSVEPSRTSREPNPSLLDMQMKREARTIEAALSLAAGVPEDALVYDQTYGDSVVSAARRRGIHGLHAALGEVLRAAGQPALHGGANIFNACLELCRREKQKELASQKQRSEAAQRYSSPVLIEAAGAGFSTIDLPGILGNVANKVLLDAFVRVDSTAEVIAEQADFANFYQHSIYRLQATGDFAKISGEGALKHGTMEQDSYTNKLDTYGQIITLSRQDIVNDDLGSFTSAVAQLGRRARIAVERALSTLLCEATDVFYTVARGNRLVGPLDITGLGAAEGALLGMADGNGDPIYAMPKLLLVPSQLKFMAEHIYTSSLVNDYTPNVARPTDNPYRNRFQVVSTPFLSSAAISGSSPSTWYLLADPALIPAFQVAYLDGRRAPTIETGDAVFNTLGMSMRAVWDFGVGRLDYRGIIKSTAS